MVGVHYQSVFPTAQPATVAALRLLGVPSYNRSGYEVCRVAAVFRHGSASLPSSNSLTNVRRVMCAV